VRSKIQELSAITPGAQDAYKQALTEALEQIQSGVLSRIENGQKETQAKLDELIQPYNAASAAADASKKTADQTDQQRFECVDKEVSLKKKAEDAKAKFSTSRSMEQEACQLQEDNKDFAYEVAERFKLGFECDLGVAGACDEQINGLDKDLAEIENEAREELAAAQKNYDQLRDTCNQKKQERAAAQNALGQAEEAWSNQRSECFKAASAHQEAKCAYGKDVKAKCGAEAEFKKLIAATNAANEPGNADSEPDRIQEWTSAATTKCMIEQDHQKGLSGALEDAALATCTSEAKGSFPTRLNRHDNDFKRNSGSNPCEEAPISFFNGQEWMVPEGSNPSSAEYVRVTYQPVLRPIQGDGWPAFEGCTPEGGENQGPGTLHLIEDPNECGEDWANLYAQPVQAVDTQQYQIGATLSSWGCDRLQKQGSKSQIKVTSTGALYAISFC